MTNHLNGQASNNPEAETRPSLTSLADWAADDGPQDMTLSTLRLSSEPAYVSFFTDQGADVEAHYLDAAADWAGGYVHCLGQACPACRARIDRKRFLLLPVADLTDALIKVLRVPAEKGPGKLRTEITKVLTLPNRDSLVVTITRGRNYQYAVEARRSDVLAPDVGAAIKRFVEVLNAGAIDLRAPVIAMAAEEMAQHERVAKRLALEGRGA